MAAFQNDEPSRVGASFVNDYYQQLTADPAGLTKYYSKETQFSHSQVDEQELAIHVGIAEISAKIESLGLQDVKTHLYSVKCHSTVNGAVLVIVNGILSNNGQPPQTFNQTFVLAKSQRKQKAYYVLNDVLVFVPSALPSDEIQEDEDEYQEEEEAVDAEEPTQAEELQQPEAPVADKPNWADEEEEPVVQAPAEIENVPEQEDSVEEEPEPAQPEPAVEAQVAPVAAPPAAPQVHAQPTAPAAKTQQEPAASSKTFSFADALKHGTKAPEQKQRKTGGTPQRVTNAAPAPTAHGAQTHGNHAPKRTSTGPQAAHNNATDAPKRPRALPQSQTRPSVYVAKVPENATDEEIREAFTPYGNVTSIRNRPAKRIAFVDFETTEGQGAAVEAAANNKVLIRGKALVVQPQRREPENGEAQPQQHAGGRGRGRGRGRDHHEHGGRGNRDREQQKASA